MDGRKKRLYFIDAMRAWAILMMLQGHFIDGLLDPIFRNDNNVVFSTWKYFRGITAPVFFTVSGFIFTFLLVKGKASGLENPRVKKGVKRGLQLLLIGYLLRLNLGGIFKGEIYPSFFLVDVLHCIGFSLLGIIALYLLTRQGKYIFPLVLFLGSFLLFLFEPVYKTWSYPNLPEFLVNYLSKSNGSVFTVIPWFGYAAFGAFLSMVFSRFREHKFLYPSAIALCSFTGVLLISSSSAAFAGLYQWTGLELFSEVYNNNYLFIRLGDVLVVFAFFMLIRKWLTSPAVLRIGQNTLAIYVIHFMLLYGSFTGIGLYRYWNHELTPLVVIPGAVAFMVCCTWSALAYDKHEREIKRTLDSGKSAILRSLEWGSVQLLRLNKDNLLKVFRSLSRVKS